MFVVFTMAGVPPDEQIVVVNTDDIVMVSVVVKQKGESWTRITLRDQKYPVDVVESIKFVFTEITRNKESR